MEFDREAVVATFLAEVEEGLQVMEEALLALEQHPDDGEALGAVFRVVHTIKGNSDSLGFVQLADFSHVLEDLLARLRTGELTVSAELVALLLEAVDALQEMTTAAASGEEGARPAHASLLARLRLAGQAEGAQPAQPGRGNTKQEERRSGSGRRAEDQDRTALPRRTLRVDIDKLDRLLNLTGEIAIARGRLGQMLEHLGGQAGEELREANSDVDRLSLELQELVMQVRLVPVGPIFRRYLRTLHDMAAAAGKEARLFIEGADVEVDTTIVEHIRDPLTHMMRNAVDHGIEPPEERRARGKDPCGRVTLRAFHEAGLIVIQVADDGAGLSRERLAARARDMGLDADKLSDHELLRLIFEPGFSTAEAVTGLSGRGVGMDVVRRNVDTLRGSISVESEEGVGTTLTVRLPLTLAIIDGFGLGVGDETFIVPLATVEECLELPRSGSERSRDSGVLKVRERPLPYVRLRELFGVQGALPEREQVVVVRSESTRAGLVVDTLHGDSQTVIKPLGRLFQGLPGLAGSAILGTGRVALILDVPAILDELTQGAHMEEVGDGAWAPEAGAAPS